MKSKQQDGNRREADENAVSTRPDREPAGERHGGQDGGARRSVDARPVLRPRTNRVETASGYTLEIALPGVEEQDLEIQLENDVLTVGADVRFEEPEGLRLVHAEFAPARYMRRFQLGSGLDPESVRAQFRNGLLRIDVRRRAPVEKRIQVNHE
jgi:HSP20 family protein